MAAEETHAGEPSRYSERYFPAYRFIPGQQPHPRRDPCGHSYGVPDPKPAAFAPEQWRASEDYRYAIDLFNFQYWWECHEIFEGLWHAVGQGSQMGNLFQALINLAAGNLKVSTGATAPAVKLWQSGLVRLEKLPSVYMGLDIRALEVQIRTRLTDHSGPVGVLHLQP